MVRGGKKEILEERGKVTQPDSCYPCVFCQGPSDSEAFLLLQNPLAWSLYIAAGCYMPVMAKQAT